MLRDANRQLGGGPSIFRNVNSLRQPMHGRDKIRLMLVQQKADIASAPGGKFDRMAGKSSQSKGAQKV